MIDKLYEMIALIEEKAIVENLLSSSAHMEYGIPNLRLTLDENANHVGDYREAVQDQITTCFEEYQTNLSDRIKTVAEELADNGF
ncbi:unnamed protein product [marine sediment metagenome]|uniref:Uncharacterized protein n=1 Tax=marine sediment metagenome TaxID=412755 RepID=X1DQM4_9ZZZZ